MCHNFHQFIVRTPNRLQRKRIIVVKGGITVYERVTNNHSMWLDTYNMNVLVLHQTLP